MFPNLVTGLRNLATGQAARRRLNERRAKAWQGKSTGLSISICDGDATGPTSNLAHEILDNYKSRSTKVRQDYLESLASDSLSYLEEKEWASIRKAHQEVSLEDSMKAVVDSVFTVMEPYVHELNRMFGSSELQISCTSPSSVTEYTDYEKYRSASKTVTRYRARISTCKLSVIVRGEGDKVCFFLLPVGMVMGLSQVEDQYHPIMTFYAVDECYSIDWEVENKPLTKERLERYCLFVLDYLLKETRDELERSQGKRPSGAA